MKRFRPPALRSMGEVIAFLKEFGPFVGREIRRVENKIPSAAPGMEEILAAVRDNAEVKDAIYRYIKEREAKEEV